jgi:curved DNA-binding protein CbpA/ketosteroid isomerase-like protein
MKDYYEILGVEEEASDEEIRARWIELAKHYHPDLGKTKEADEKIKEINEAYEVLKDNSKRFDYDFERTFKRSLIKRAHRSKERRIPVQKIMLSAGTLVVFLIIGVVSFRWFHVASPPKSGVPYEMGKALEEKTASRVPPVKTELEVQGDQEVPKEIKKEMMPQESVKIVSVSPQRSPQKILPKSKLPVKVEGKVPAKEEPKPVKEPVPQVAMKSEAPVRVEKEVPKESPKQVAIEVPKEVVREVAKEAPKEIPREVPKETPKQVPKEIPKEVAKEGPKELPKEVSTVTLHHGERLTLLTREERVVSSRPSPLAKEEEVKQFFSNYIDRYTRKDIDGFLSFFSSRALQNQKDGLKEIRKIYTKYFDQSQELRYHVEGMKIEIDQNVVKVKARFRVDQRLKKRGEEKVWGGNIRWVLVKEDGNLKISSLDYKNEKAP